MSTTNEPTEPKRTRGPRSSVIAQSELHDAEGKSTGRRIVVLDAFQGDLVRIRLDVDENHEGGQETWAHIDEIGKAKTVVTDVDAHLANMSEAQLRAVDVEKHAVLFGVKSKTRDAFIASRSSALEAHERHRAEEHAKREAAELLRREQEERSALEGRKRLEERLRAMMQEEIARAAAAAPASATPPPA
jgi:hypothetical protein